MRDQQSVHTAKTGNSTVEEGNKAVVLEEGSLPSVLAASVKAASFTRRLLSQPATAPRTVAEVARRCGFASVAHFSTAFTARFGERPTDVRRQALANRRPDA